MSNSYNDVELEACLLSANEGSDDARQKLLLLAEERLLALSRKLKRGFPRVGRWEQTEDVCQQATLKLYQALKQTAVVDSRHFFRLAAKKNSRNTHRYGATLSGRSRGWLSPCNAKDHGRFRRMFAFATRLRR